ncbi:hypothetical protein [Streptomyces sp. BPTC-684]|uniref:hypothetical protein n=1 Tax=Streptomyces sp. BPTC-684 TaxID=3043734 RepID=UPI0024B13D82|nr:hypothetical protein [Streptomyces sp. BPTC-684]WHM41104.1 hypothetical protein QIY60_32440 [Streptomyces sp. BPTC-684]
MGEIDHEIAGEVASLQADIASVLQELEGLPEDDPRYEPLFAQLERAGSVLLAYEAEVPAKLEAPHREASESVLTWSTRAHMAGGVLLGLAPFTGWIGWGWVVLALLQVVVGAVLAGNKPVAGKHRQLRYAAAVLSVVTVLVPLLAFAVLPALVWFVPPVGWVVASVISYDATQAEGRATA